MTVLSTWSVAVRTKFYGPTNSRGAKVRAWRGDLTSPSADPNAVTISYSHALSPKDNAVEATAAYLDKVEWEGDWVVGSLDADNTTAVRVDAATPRTPAPATAN